MTILVIGGTRFFGKQLVRMLLEEGHKVSILSRGLTSDDFGSLVTRLKADRTQAAELEAALGDKTFDAVIDQVCMNAEQAQIAVQSFKERTPYYLYTSTLSVYPLGKELKEEDFEGLNYKPEKPKTPSEEYAEGKRAAEKVFQEQTFFKTSFARFPVVVGDDDYTERLLKHVCAVSQGKEIYFPNLDAQFGFIQSVDAARALRWLVDHRKAGSYNFASSDSFSLGQLMAEIGSAVGKDVILAESGNEQNGSPYGVPETWTMNVDKARSEGFECPPQSEWLRPLLQRLKEKCQVINSH